MTCCPKSAPSAAPSTGASDIRVDPAAAGDIVRFDGGAELHRHGSPGPQGGWRGSAAAGTPESVRHRASCRDERALRPLRRGYGIRHRSRAVRLELRVPDVPRRAAERPRARSTRRGGAGSTAPAGAARKGSNPPSRGARTIRSSMFRGTTPAPSRNGAADASRPRPSGSMRPAAGPTTGGFPGGTRSRTTSGRSATSGRGVFPT